VYVLVRHSGKAVFLVRVGEDHLSAVHSVGINVYGVSGVGDEHYVIIAKNVYDIAAVALSAVVYSYLVSLYFYAKALVVAADGIFEEIIACAAVLVALVSFFNAHFVSALFHSLYYALGDRLGNVAYTHADNVGVRVRLGKSLYLLGDVDKKIILFKL